MQQGLSKRLYTKCIVGYDFVEKKYQQIIGASYLSLDRSCSCLVSLIWLSKSGRCLLMDKTALE